MDMNTSLKELKNKGDDLQKSGVESTRQAKDSEASEAKGPIADLVMPTARLKPASRAEPGPTRPSRAEPKLL